jgi:hypothetical protein
MRKAILFLLVFIGLATICTAQEERKNIDYQYVKSEGNYHAYTAYTSKEANTIDLNMVSSYDLANIKAVQIKTDKNTIKVPFKKLDFLIFKDDGSLNKLSISINIEKLLNTKLGCESFIIFSLADKKTITLPFNNCLFREVLLKN